MNHHNIIVDIINVILSKFRMQNLQVLFAELPHLATAGGEAVLVLPEDGIREVSDRARSAEIKI
jgi:hypothetical protein